MTDELAFQLAQIAAVVGVLELTRNLRVFCLLTAAPHDRPSLLTTEDAQNCGPPLRVLRTLYNLRWTTRNLRTYQQNGKSFRNRVIIIYVASLML